MTVEDIVAEGDIDRRDRGINGIEVASFEKSRRSPRAAPAESGAPEGASGRWSLGGRRPACTRRLELSLEEALVDLAVVDRDGLLDADPDDLVSIETQLLRQLLRR